MEQAVYRRMADVQDLHWWYEGRRAILSSLIKTLNLPKDIAILEAGCGPGANLRMLSSFGNVYAFDIDDFAVHHARENSGVAADHIQIGSLPSSIPHKGPFNLIGAFDVIEHVEQDLESLIALRKLLKPGGYAVFTVPAFPFLWSAHDVANHHKRRYRENGFRNILFAAGYDVTFISYYNTWLFPAVVLARFLKKILGIKDTPDENLFQGNSLLNRLLRALFASERHLISARCGLPFGVSIIALCRNPAP